MSHRFTTMFTKRILAASTALTLVAGALNDVRAAELEEIVVTARKREENLQTVPIAVTALTGAELAQRGQLDLTAVDSMAPNVNFSANQPTSGISGATVVFIRGIGARDFTINIDPAVGVYVDGVYVGRTTGSLMDLIDVERVEVLRGPQNTLFGRNTIGGAISLVSKRPSPESTNATVSLAGGENSFYEGNATTNVAFSDRVAGRFTGFFRKRDGYVDALQHPGLKLGQDNLWGARGAVSFQISDAVTLDVAGDYSERSEAPAPVVPVNINRLTPLGTVGAGQFSVVLNSLARSGNAACATLAGQATIPACYGPVWQPADRFATNARFFNEKGVIPSSIRNTLDVAGVNATLTADLPFGQFKSITAYREFDAFSYQDVDFAPQIGFANNHPEWYQDQFSQEVQLVGDIADGKADYVTGLYYFEEDGLERIFNLIVASVSPTNPGGLNQDIYRNIDNSSKAGYGQFTFHATDALHLTGGIRYTKDRKTFTIRNVLPTGAIQGPSTGQQKVSEWTPSLTLGWDAADSSYLYASYSEGFRDGGFAARFIGPFPNPLPSYNPEYVKAYEIGSKNTLLDNTVRLNLAAFQTDYTDLQVDATVPPQLQLSQTSTILNLGKARMKGFEAELDAAISDNFKFDATLGYLDAKIKALTGGTLTSGPFSITTANPLPFAPEWNWNLGGTYTFDVGNEDSVLARLDWSYTDSQFYSAEGVRDVFEPSRDIVNASIRYVNEAGGWELGVGVRNLTDEVYFVQRTNISALNSTFGALGRPREFYATFKKKFGE